MAAPPFGKCVWCERTDFTEEHILGRQFAKAIGVTFPVVTWDRFRLPEKTGVVLNDRVCKTCNQNWMRKLDDKVMKCIAPAVRTGSRIQLNQREQAIVSVWATKIALLLALRQIDLIAKYPELQAAGNRAWLPDGIFEAVVKDLRRPPNGTQVWLGARPPGVPFRESVGSMEDFEETSPGVFGNPVTTGYQVLFSLNRFAVYVFGCAPREVKSFSPAELIDPRALRRIWPSRERVAEWPPPEPLDAHSLHVLAPQPANPPSPPERGSWPVGPPQRRRPKPPPT